MDVIYFFTTLLALVADADVDPTGEPSKLNSLTQSALQELRIAGFEGAGGEQDKRRRAGSGLSGKQHARLAATTQWRRWAAMMSLSQLLSWPVETRLSQDPAHPRWRAPASARPGPCWQKC